MAPGQTEENSWSRNVPLSPFSSLPQAFHEKAVPNLCLEQVIRESTERKPPYTQGAGSSSSEESSQGRICKDLSSVSQFIVVRSRHFASNTVYCLDDLLFGFAFLGLHFLMKAPVSIYHFIILHIITCMFFSCKFALCVKCAAWTWCG